MSVIELVSVTKSFNVGRENQFTAVDDVSLKIEEGLVTVLQGPSGSGKTTLLTLIGCMARPTAGRIILSAKGRSILPGQAVGDEIEISGLPERFLTWIRRTTFGFIFQHFNLVNGITVLENVMLPSYPAGEPHGEVRRRALNLLEMFNISRHVNSSVEQLSGGEKQRVAIARALINNPSVIIADEPTAHLDSKLSAEFMEIIASFRSEGKTILVASHDPIVSQGPVADMVIEMRDGIATKSGRVP
jgi:putative ABC transport system ATP-binding protein